MLPSNYAGVSEFMLALGAAIAAAAVVIHIVFRLADAAREDEE